MEDMCVCVCGFWLLIQIERRQPPPLSPSPLVFTGSRAADSALLTVLCLIVSSCSCFVLHQLLPLRPGCNSIFPHLFFLIQWARGRESHIDCIGGKKIMCTNLSTFTWYLDQDYTVQPILCVIAFCCESYIRTSICILAPNDTGLKNYTKHDAKSLR